MEKKKLYMKPKMEVFDIQPRQILMTSGVQGSRQAYGTASEDDETIQTWE